MAEVLIREARRDDCGSIVQLSREIANYHKHFNSPQQDPKVLERDIFDVENPNMGVYVAVVEDAVIGYGHYNYTYTIRQGRSMILQDLYVQDEFRNRKVGEKLMQAIAKKAVEQNISRIEFIVTDWNPAKKFYLRKGAVDVTDTDKFHFYQMSRDAINKTALDQS